eukprot:gene12278-13543_t
MSRYLANFFNVQRNNETEPENEMANRNFMKRNELVPLQHEGWNRGWAHFHNRLNVPDFGFHDLHQVDAHDLLLEEHGSDVNVVALKKHGTKVHMSGGDFNVIRDPWRHHSLFAGLFHPHEMPGHGQLPMEQFHQHFTYIANDRAVTVAAQTKQQISTSRVQESADVITIPLHDISSGPRSDDSSVMTENAEARSVDHDVDDHNHHHDEKKQPGVEGPRSGAPNGMKFGPDNRGTVVEIPLAPIVVKRQLVEPHQTSAGPGNNVALTRIVKRSDQGYNKQENEDERGKQFARAFLGKMFLRRARRT